VTFPVTFAASRIIFHEREEPNVSDGPAAAPADPSSEPGQAPGDPEAEIAEALSRGETRRAIALCAERYALRIGRLCMAMLGSQRAADDVLLETLLSAEGGASEAKGAPSLRAWLFAVAYAKCLEQLEQRRRRGTPVEPGGDDSEEDGPQDAVALRAERARTLLEHVRPSEREALLLRYGADLSFEEAAAVAGIPVATVRERVARALLRLRGALRRGYGGD
jgi:RNA polymerase sigma-70 factor, ECF subfamily